MDEVLKKHIEQEILKAESHKLVVLAELNATIGKIMALKQLLVDGEKLSIQKEETSNDRDTA